MGKVNDEKSEALIGYAADALKHEGRAFDVPRKNVLWALAEIQLMALERFEERVDGKVSRSSADIAGRPAEPCSLPLALSIQARFSTSLERYHPIASEPGQIMEV